ncbi:biotin--protein ligase-like [Tubulanus polymorphus]|uniref:biotin--protein ligase-like n=1 Tax=Tubulanus polymorphus TaxID=672921 RepID=UPI003DA22CCB
MFTAACFILSWQHRSLEARKKMCFTKLLRTHLRKGSVILQTLQQPQQEATKTGSKFTEIPHGFKTRNLEQSITGNTISGILTEPQLILPLRGWTSYLASQNKTPDYIRDKTHNAVICVLLEAVTPDDLETFCSQSLSIPLKKRINVVDIAVPLAWRAGNPFGILLECTPDKYISLADAFIQQYLTVSESLQITKLISVKVEGKPSGLLRTKSDTESVNVFHTPVGSHDDLTHSTDLHNYTHNRSIVMRENKSDNITGLSDNITGLSNNITGLSDNVTGRPDKGLPDKGLPDVMNRNMKPPNVLIYCGKIDSKRIFESIKSVVDRCLNIDCYAIYHLKYDDISKSPWKQNAILLIVATEKLDSNAKTEFQDYLQNGGNVVSLCSSIDEEFMTLKSRSNQIGIISIKYENRDDLIHVISGKYSYNVNSNNQYNILATDGSTGDPVVIHLSTQSGQIILSQVHFEKDPIEFGITSDLYVLLKKSNEKKFEILKELFMSLGIDCSETHRDFDVKPFYLMSVTQAVCERFLASIKPRLKSGNKLSSRKATLEFVDSEPQTDIDSSVIPIINKQQNSDHIEFNMSLYRQNISTQFTGNIVLYSQLTRSTMDLFDGFMFHVPDNVGVVAIAARQIDGKGRGGNKWIGPDGCAMFSFHVRHDCFSTTSYLQHIASLAVVHAVKHTPGYQDINLRLKWPNDIYYGDHMKLGGVLVNCTSINNVVHAIIGCGFNVSNRNPLICLNDVIEQFNTEHNTTLKPFTIEQFIAKSITEFELLKTGFQLHGSDWFLKQYYNVWLHGDLQVTIDMNNEFVSGRVIGLDKYGYLSVAIDDGDIVSVQPDGNTFDMMKNLICPK